MEKRQKRSMNLANVSHNSLPIPTDITIMIFAKLPLKSIARCRCVSKLWDSILRRSDFTELFLSKSLSTIPKLLFACQKHSEMLFYSSLEPQNVDENSSSVLTSYQMKFSCRDDYPNFNLVHGLFLFDDTTKSWENVVKICNPSTGQLITLPNLKTSYAFVWNLLGYDPIDKQFKVLSMTKSGRYAACCDEFQFLTLGSENRSWRMVDCCVPHDPPHKDICINGVLYYIDLHGHQIACFDVRLEKFYFVETMETFKRSWYNEVHLINYNGKLGLIQLYVGNERSIVFDGRSITVNLWVLEDQETHKWSQHTFLFSNVPKYEVGRWDFEVVGMTKKNEIVLSSTYGSYPYYDLIYLNLEKKTIVSVEIQGMERPRTGKCFTFLDHVENVKLY